MAKILPQPGISQIELYQGGSSHIEGVSNVVKLSSNENPFGPSDAAIEAFYPGLVGAGVIANSIFGNGKHFNRWGRMPCARSHVFTFALLCSHWPI